MSDKDLPLAAGFPEASYADWLTAAEKALKRADVEKALATRTYEGFALKALYTRDRDSTGADPSGLPGVAPFIRGADAAGRTVGGWDMRQTHATQRRETRCAKIGTGGPRCRRSK